MNHDPKRMVRIALWTAAGLLLLSVVFVTLIWQDEWALREFVGGVTLAEMILCFVVGGAAMAFGYGRAILRRSWYEPEPLLGFGAAMAVIAFALAVIVGTAVGLGL